MKSMKGKKMKKVNRKPSKVDVWSNGCGANVGKHVIHFTGIMSETNPLHEGIYVTLKNPTWMCSSLIYVANRRASCLRNAIKLAKTIKHRS